MKADSLLRGQGDHEHQFHGFMTLAAAMQERAPPRGVPDQTIASLPTATFQEWATPDSDQMCPICFEDYNAPDPVLKLPDCNHWIHKPCLEVSLFIAKLPARTDLTHICRNG
ncbi:hypothetical protein PUNSTDRAFT_76009 [Punctularia strigosozonata HHB-11173 SS5]|uniref:RING-type domain-containing protein n=1 Tax=Punctularia strigosozonata (strain HHB-11173) TaxID=741275 RepID=R7S350_PUNST|nr:uncharacterized protein PUNSTDRAFT_76009 [Punctularia strigosozonata HHB-11173 SS5]EIN04653.1 hypothetical protein PUNSTDRAFT_76009 [Punctularia strigosozonata HHB-11173 SS5]